MSVGFPHFGNVYIPIKAMTRRLGAPDGKVIIPPPITQRTLDLGIKYSPQEACLPYKLTLGSLIEACELGADTLIQARGTGICRLGYYAKGQEQMLQDLGYNAHFLTLDVSHNKFISIIRLIQGMSDNTPLREIISAFFFSIGKLFALDRVEKGGSESTGSGG